MSESSRRQRNRVLSPRDVHASTQLARQLLTFTDGEPSALEAWVANTREVLGLTNLILYGLQPEPTGYSTSFRHYDTTSAGAPNLDTFAAHLRTVGRKWGLFDPMRPEPLQRNRALITEPIPLLAERLERGESHDPLVRRSADAEAAGRLRRDTATYKSIGILHRWQLRALVCENDSLLGWVGGYTDTSPTWRQRAILQRLIPSLQRRLSIQEALGAPRLALVLSTALNEIPSAAFVVGPRGTVDFANLQGRAQLDRSPTETRRELASAIGGAPGFRVAPVLAGGAQYHLVIGPRPSGLHERLALAICNWELTPQQALVLELVIEGLSNKVIAQRLNCATHTAELHVAAIRAKAGAESRSELAAKFWMHL